MIGTVKNFIYSSNHDRIADNPDIPSDYILYARFDGNYKDRSTNHNDLKLYSGSSTISWRTGRKNKKSVHFAGDASESFTTTNNIIYATNKLTISFWIYIEEIGGIRRLLTSNETGTGASSWAIFLGSSSTIGNANYDKILIYYRTDTNSNNIFRTTNSPPTNQWLHLAIVINKDASPQRKVFVNNVSQTMVSVSGSTDTSNFVSDKARLGVSIKGNIQYLRIYKRELSITEIGFLYNEFK